MERCLIIPVHPPKCNWLLAFLTSLNFRHALSTKPPGDASDAFSVVLAVSNFADLVFFERLLNATGLAAGVRFFLVDAYILDTINSPRLLARFQDNTDGCVVNLKKLLALHWAESRGCEWALCIDSDVLAIQDMQGLFDVLIDNYNSRKYFGASGQSGLFEKINQATSGVFPESDRAALQEVSKSGSFYCWFFDVPCYKTSDFMRCLHHMAGPDGAIENWFLAIDHYSFDHLLFIFWRLVHDQGIAVDYTELGIDRLPENLTSHDLLRISDRYGYCPAWINTVAMAMEPGVIGRLPNLRIAYHFDRLTATRGA